MTTPGYLLFLPGFLTEEIRNGDVTIHVRIGGSGPAVVMLHGLGETGDMWAPLAAAPLRLAHDRRTRFARYGPCLTPGGGVREANAGRRYHQRNGRGRDRAATLS
jgi:pimeloyl-ACP methyl ester carboxylesterase